MGQETETAVKFDDGFGSDRYDPSAGSALKFEAYSKIGRIFSPRVRSTRNAYLHIGCGSNILDGFDNIDFYALRFWKARHIGHDLRYPLPYAAQTFSGVYSEHTLEHMPAAAARRLLREIHRVLIPGSIARITVPDLRKYVDYYQGLPSNPEFARFGSGCEAIWSLTQYWTHLSCWDAAMLTHELRAAGFASAVEASFGSGANSALLCDTEDRRWETLYVEAVA